MDIGGVNLETGICGEGQSAEGDKVGEGEEEEEAGLKRLDLFNDAVVESKDVRFFPKLTAVAAAAIAAKCAEDSFVDEDLVLSNESLADKGDEEIGEEEVLSFGEEEVCFLIEVEGVGMEWLLLLFEEFVL